MRRGEAGSGRAQDFFELTTELIDVGAVARRVVPARCGATVTLDGYAREWTRGRRTLHLVYEAYAPMALAEMQRLGRRGAPALRHRAHRHRPPHGPRRDRRDIRRHRRQRAPPPRRLRSLRVGHHKNSSAPSPSGRKSFSRTAKCGSKAKVQRRVYEMGGRNKMKPVQATLPANI